MNCKVVNEKLSAFVDGELNTHQQQEIQSHVDTCDHCRCDAEQLVVLGQWLRRAETSTVTVPAWERFAGCLDSQPMLSVPTRPMQRGIGNWAFALLGTAASIGLLWLAFNQPSMNRHPEQHDLAAGAQTHDAMVVDLQEVFQSVSSDPTPAIGKLVAMYRGQQLDRAATIDYLGYEPALLKSVPAGFTLTSTHVLEMPCCKCSASVCTRRDGTSLVVLEHQEPQPAWFGNMPAIEMQCAGQSCKIIESAGKLAVTWRNQNRQLTLIGAHDKAEVDQLVSSLKL